MDIHSIAFWFCVFFLLGVFFISVFGNFLFSALAGILIASYFLFYKKYAFVLLSLSVIMGAAYFLVFDYAQNAINLPFGVKTEFSGIVKKLEQSATRLCAPTKKLSFTISSLKPRKTKKKYLKIWK